MSSPQTQPQKQLSLVLREVEVKTPGHAPTGPKYEHPLKQSIDYQNPIDRIINNNYDCYCKFGSRNGDVTDIKSSGYPLNKTNLIPQDKVVKKININYHSDYISGFKIFSADNELIAQAGR